MTARIPAAQLRAFLDPLDAAHVPDDPDPARKAGGRDAAEHGRAWERELVRHHRRCESQGWGFVLQCGRPVIGFGSNGPVYGRAPTDFLGALRVRGALVPVAIEAKSRERRLLRAEIEEHQRAILDVCGEGGIALVAVELRAFGRFCVPWGVVEALWDRSRGGGSVGAAELRGWEMAGDVYLRRFCG